MATGDMHKNLVKIPMEFSSYVSRQTNIHTYHNTLPPRVKVTSEYKIITDKPYDSCYDL